MHARHLYVCGAIMVVALVLVALGSGAWALLAPLGCVVMMVAMMWMMVRAGHHRGGR